MFTCGFVFVTAIDTVRDCITEGILRKTLTTSAAEALGVTGNPFITSGFITAIRTFPSTVADGGPRKTGTIVTLEGFFRTGLVCLSTVLFIGSIVAVLVLVTHKIPGDTLTIPTLEGVCKAARVLGTALGSGVLAVTDPIPTNRVRVSYLTLNVSGT